eukprot:m.74832 g.74832  ORF g.74832 m.74832 type:complete len:459 (-) comp11822_c0_seq1:725-2101(-)
MSLRVLAHTERLTALGTQRLPLAITSSVRLAHTAQQRNPVLYPWTVAGIKKPTTTAFDKNVYTIRNNEGAETDVVDYSANLISTLVDSQLLCPAINKACASGMLAMAPEHRTEAKDFVAQTLIDNSPIENKDTARTWFGCTGSDGVSTSVWACMRTTDKTGLMFMDHSFHGGEFYASQVGTDPRGIHKRSGHMRLHRFPPLPRPTKDSDYEAMMESSFNTLKYLKDEIGVLVVDGSSGSPLGIPWPKGYLPELVSIARGMDIRVVVDEVMSGLKRCGAGLFAASNRDGGVVADAVVYGKALTNGILPLSAVVFGDTTEFDDTPWGHGSTFSGTYMSMAICEEMLKMIQTEEFDNRVSATEKLILDHLTPLVEDPSCSVSDIQGSGVMWTVFFDLNDADSAAMRLGLKEHYNARQFGLANRMMVAPTLDITEDHMVHLCNSIRSLDKQLYKHSNTTAMA